MRREYTFIALFIFFASTLVAQDTLLFENFNTPFDTLTDATDGVASSPNGSDQIWVNLDADNLPDANGYPTNWYWQNQWLGSDTNSQGGVLVSSSWLANNDDGAENWLILPPLHLADGSAVLSWKSAPFQGPRYMDGYKVVVSAFQNFPAQFTETIFEHAQMIPPLGLDTFANTYTFSSGEVHANGYTNYNQFYYNQALNGFHGLLQEHSVSLAQFSGYTIYIAFVHDSDDDNQMALDDILVTGTAVVSTNSIENISNIEVFPNPASDYLRVSYISLEDKAVDIRIFDMQGRLVDTKLAVSNAIGEIQQTINITQLPTGTYELVLYQNGQKITQSFVKL